MLSGTDRQSGATPSSPTLLPSERGEGSTIPDADSKPLAQRTAPGTRCRVPSGRGVVAVGVRVHRKTVAVFLGIQLLLAAIALGVWVWTPDQQALPPLPDGTAPLAGSGATYESALPLAQSQADDWLPGAVLLNAS